MQPITFTSTVYVIRHLAVTWLLTFLLALQAHMTPNQAVLGASIVALKDLDSLTRIIPESSKEKALAANKPPVRTRTKPAPKEDSVLRSSRKRD